MAVTVVKHPTGHKISPQEIAGAITNIGGDALITALYHGLGTGDFVYITSDIDEYNGFWYVTAIDTDTFKISEYATADFVEYFQDADIEYYLTLEHVWSSIFLPIVYKCNNTRWPTNSVDLERTISSFADDNGYTNLIASGNLKLSAAALEYVIISGSNVDGVYQIVEVISSTEYVIDLPYDSTNTLTGATIQYYYNNYQVKVKVYGGLPVSHPWYAKKPYVEVAELSLTPDADGIVMFSVSDYIRSKVQIKNNLTLFSLPLNLDAFTVFYIATTETFDDSDGYTLTTNEVQDFEDDTFEGYAIAGKLPFKNVYSGDYADYIYTDSNPAAWLTSSLDRLVAVEDKYFDVSFIKNIVGDFTLTINKYVSDYLTTVETIHYEDQGIGVYRIPIEVDSVYDSFCISVANIAPDPVVIEDILTWGDAAGPYPGNWNYAVFGQPFTSVNGGGGVEGYTCGTLATVSGSTYAFTTVLEIFESGSFPVNMTFIWAILDSGFNELATETFVYTSEGFKHEEFNLTPTGTGVYFGVRVINDTVSDTKSLVVRLAVGFSSPQLLTNPEFTSQSPWTNGGAGTSWTFASDKASVTLASGLSKELTQSFTPGEVGHYHFISEYETTNIGGGEELEMTVEAYDESNNLIDSKVESAFVNQVQPWDFEFDSLVPIAKIIMKAEVITGTNIDVSLAYAGLFGPVSSEPGVSATITEEICIDIIESCEAQGGFVPTDIRLLEDGSYRLLE
jgi:hypothetical protein